MYNKYVISMLRSMNLLGDNKRKKKLLDMSNIKLLLDYKFFYSIPNKMR